MKRSNFIILGIIICSVSGFSQPDTLWTQVFGDSQYDLAHSVCVTMDGGYAFTGATASYGPGSYDIYLIKMECSGLIEWQKVYGEAGYSEVAWCVDQTADGGYIIAGRKSPSYPANDDIYLIRTDSLGDTIWTRRYGGRSTDRSFEVKQTADGGFIVAGTTYSYNEQGDLLLLKTDENGDSLWMNHYGGGLTDYCRGMDITSDNGYILTGTSYSHGAGMRDLCLLKTDMDGELEWHQNYGGDFEEDGWKVRQTADGGYIVIGATYSYGAGSSDFFIVKTDSFGDTLWTKVYGGSSQDYGNCLDITSDNGYIFGGYTQSYGAGEMDFYLIKTDSNGDSIWTLVLGDSERDYCHSVKQTNDGGYIAVGDKDLGGYMYQDDAWIVRFEGDIHPLNVSITPHNIPIQIPAAGDTFYYDIEITNTGGNLVCFNGWMNLVFEDSLVYEPHSLHKYMSIAPNRTLRWENQPYYISAAEPPGQYTYYGYIGAFPNSIWFTDYFEFEKLPGEDAAEIYNTQAGFELLSGFFFNPPHPNPFNQRTALSYQLSAKSFVNLSVYDITGREVARLVDGYTSAGTHEVIFDAKDLVSGVYFVRLKAGGFCQTRKILFVK